MPSRIIPTCLSPHRPVLILPATAYTLATHQCISPNSSRSLTHSVGKGEPLCIPERHSLTKEQQIMKAHTKKIISAAVLGLALLAHTVPTWAGATQSYEVTISSTNGMSTAYGAVSAARYSSDTKQSIGCLISSTPGYSIAYCSAWDK